MCSGSLESPHLSAAFIGEGTHWVYCVTVHELTHLRKRLVRCKIRLDNHANDGLRRFDHGSARQHPHLADQRVHADQCSDLCLVVREGVSIELRCLVDELLVQLLSSALVLQNSLGAVLMVLSEPRRRERR